MKKSGTPLARLRALQAHAHERRASALAAYTVVASAQEDELDFTPTAMLMDLDLVCTPDWQGARGQ